MCVLSPINGLRVLGVRRVPIDMSTLQDFFPIAPNGAALEKEITRIYNIWPLRGEDSNNLSDLLRPTSESKFDWKTVASETLARLLDRLDELKRSFGATDEVRLDRILSSLDRRRVPDAPSLIRFHETLLFIRAYPHSPHVLRQVERILARFSQRVALVLRAGEDIEVFADPEISGIVGTPLTAIFSYPIVRWLTSPPNTRMRCLPTSESSASS